jgi:hypothetical protein
LVVVSIGQVAGMMRLGTPGQRLQKSLEDAAEDPFSVPVRQWLADRNVDSSQVLDLMTVAVRRNWRGTGVFDSMLRVLPSIGKHLGCTHLAGIFDDTVLRYIRRRGLFLEKMGDREGPYYGSRLSVPVLAPLTLVREVLAGPDWVGVNAIHSGLLAPACD